MEQLWLKIIAIFVVSFINLEIIVSKPADPGRDIPQKKSTNYRCVESNQCNYPIAPNPAIGNEARIPPDLALYDGNGHPIWPLSFCKRACINEDAHDTRNDEITVDEETHVRSGGNFDNVKVCCGDQDLIFEAQNQSNWSLTKDPARCDEFEKDGYRCVPEEECKNDGYFEDSDAPDFGVYDCKTIEIGVKNYQDEERKKYSGNVCCRVTNTRTVGRTRTDEHEDEYYDDTRTTKQFCTERTGYSCVPPSHCFNEGTEESTAFSDAVSERDGESTDEFAASAICKPPTDEPDLFTRSGGNSRDRRQAPAGDEVCCHEDNVRPPCTDISDTHRCVLRQRCSPLRRRKSEIVGSTSVRSGGDDLHPSERHCSKDGPRQGSDQIRNSFQSIISPNKFEDIISERKDAGRDYDVPNYDAYDYENDYKNGYENGYDNNDDKVRGAMRDDDNYDDVGGDGDYVEEDLLCCDHKDILPEVIEETGLIACSDKLGFKCIPQATCRNSQILISNDEEEENEKLVTFGVRVDQFNQTLLSQQGNLCNSVLEVCCNINDVPTSLIHEAAAPPENYQSKCGNRNEQGVDVTVDGKEDRKQLTQFGEWPNMCAISTLNARTGKNIYLGGASLITAGIAVTAAHKVMDISPEDIRVRCGEWDAKQAIEPRPYQNRDVESVSIHPSFDSKNVYNDVALLHVAEEFKLDRHIDRICLPPPGDRLSYLNRGCKATGWGKDKYEGGSYQVLMAQVELPIVENFQCEYNLREYTALSDSFKLDESFMCAGGEVGVDTCVGDGGGPLMCPSADDPTRWIQAGITAWGIGCGERNVPGVYASMAEATCFIDWATKCKHGDKYINDYDFKECNNDGASTWIDEEIARLQEILTKAEFHLRRSNLSKRQRRRYNKRRANTQQFIEKAQDMQAGCNVRRTENTAFEEEVFVRQQSEDKNGGADEYYDENYEQKDYENYSASRD